MFTRTLAALVDLVLPSDCAGCGKPPLAGGVCGACAAILDGPAAPAHPTPAPAGLPPCVAVGDYEDPLRELILAYKERGRRGLAGPLGRALAGAVRTGWPLPDTPVALVPVPSTAAAVRERHGDHMLRLARETASWLGRVDVEAAVVTPLRARPRADSTHLSRGARAEAAQSAFTLRRGDWPGLRRVTDTGAVVLLDDVLTTGSTLAAVANLLLTADIPVTFAATLAVTRLRAS
jgi:predicted amidophosphoribosyltransferase